MGVVESDENFNIIRKYTVLFDPETRFVTKFRKPINFDVDEKALKGEKSFSESYPFLREFFDRDALFLAHAATNDGRMLNYACKRYHLPPLDYVFICSQMIYSVFADVEDGIGLEVVAELMGEEFIHHNAEEDAYMSLKLVKYICAIKNMTLSELLSEYGISYGRVKNYEIKMMRSEALDAQRAIRKAERIAEKQRIKGMKQGENDSDE
jgi:DNA polymerase III epsilon subunit-like protein